jgi:hypothetical protein
MQFLKCEGCNGFKPSTRFLKEGALCSECEIELNNITDLKTLNFLYSNELKSVNPPRRYLFVLENLSIFCKFFIKTNNTISLYDLKNFEIISFNENRIKEVMKVDVRKKLGMFKL